MEIIEIYEPYIYSIKYDSQEENEFDRLLKEWRDLDFIQAFMEANREFLKNKTWNKTPEPFSATRKVLREAEKLDDWFEQLYHNTLKEERPDFDEHFRTLGGKYKYEVEFWPSKSYGREYPSFLRIYAIRIAPNTYLITGGGIKLSDSIQNSPGLGNRILHQIDTVRHYLKDNGIMDSDDLEYQ